MAKKPVRYRRRASQDVGSAVPPPSSRAPAGPTDSDLQREVAELREKNRQLEATATRLTGELSRLTEDFEKRLGARGNSVSSQIGRAMLALLQSPAALLRLPGRPRPSPSLSGRKVKAFTREELAVAYESGGMDSLRALFDEQGASAAALERSLLALAKQYQKDNQPAKAAALGRAAYDINPQPTLAKWLAFRLYDAGQIKEPLALLEGPADGCAFSASEARRLQEIKTLASFAVSLPEVPPKASPAYEPADGSLLYVAASCLPYHTSGYTTRTHELNLALQKTGKVTVVTRPGYPWDRPDRQGLPEGTSTTVEGLEYLHIRTPSLTVPLNAYFREAAAGIAKVAANKKVATIHAASNHVNALPALLAARQLGLPFAYEMRGLWDMTRAAKVEGYEESDRYRLGMRFEALVAQEADRVFVISEALGEYIRKEWGVDPAKIELLPNCVNPETIERAKRMAGPKPDVFTVGYAGSLVEYEGLDLLIDALAELKQSGTIIHARIIGDGPERKKLEDQAEKAGLNEQVHFLGRLTPDEARARLAETHAAVLPRRCESVCQLVPPIKIHEAALLVPHLILPKLDIFITESANSTCALYHFEPASTRSLASLLCGIMTAKPPATDPPNLSPNVCGVEGLWEVYAPRLLEKLVPTLPLLQQPRTTARPDNVGSDRSLRKQFQLLLEEASEIPSSNGHAYFAKHPLHLAVIADIYLYNYYKDVCDHVTYLSPDNCRSQDFASFDLILYTTCWKGISNEEWRGVKFREKPKQALAYILQQARCHGIPTAFQSIEDPSNFDYFLPIAQQFDFVFTADIECIAPYQEALKTQKVYFQEYGFNPKLNNPIGCRRKIRNAAFFAGSYPKRYRDRCSDMETIFDSILAGGGKLVIADRNYATKSAELAYPTRYKDCLIAPVEHELLQSVHKLFRYNLNFNSITQSPTMCAMRAYELQATGCGIISNYARSLFNNFPNIRTLPVACDLSESFSAFQPWEERYSNCRNIRTIFSVNTSFDVFGRMLNVIGLKHSQSGKPPMVCIVCDRITPHLQRCFDRQTYPNKLLIEDRAIEAGRGLLGISAQSEVAYFGWFSATDSYEAHYIEDLINVFKFTGCAYATKDSHFDAAGHHSAGLEHEYTSTCSGRNRSLFRVSDCDFLAIRRQPADDAFELPNGYASDPFSLNYTRHLMTSAQRPESYALSVVIPVHNNGRFLEGKCLPSVQNNRRWHEFELLLADDNSTDVHTKNLLSELEESYPNIRILHNPQGPSGSASVPRNMGIDAAAAPLITFLDPDNEISPAGYDNLLNLSSTSDPEVAFISGFNVKVGSNTTILARRTTSDFTLINDPKLHYLDNGKFPVLATQAAVIATSLLRGYGIRYVEQSAGQDTLFGWELLAAAKKAAFTASSFLIYYCDRAGSVTNDPGIRYFAKKLILETYQHTFLKNNGLLHAYRSKHFLEFMNNWYFKHFQRVQSAERPDCYRLLQQIAQLYGFRICWTVDSNDLQIEDMQGGVANHE